METGLGTIVIFVCALTVTIKNKRGIMKNFFMILKNLMMKNEYLILKSEEQFSKDDFYHDKRESLISENHFHWHPEFS